MTAPPDPSEGVARLSRSLHALYGSEAEPIGLGWMDKRLRELRALVDHERAWWGECSAAEGADPPLNWLHGSVGLAAGFAEEWNAISAADEFAGASMGELGKVCRSSGHESPGAGIEAFSRRHDLFHAMAITLELPGSGLMFFVSLYRGERAQAFSDFDALLFGEYGAHLARCWHSRLRQRLRSTQAAASDTLALCEPSGQVLYLGRTLAEAIRRTLVDWQGTTMPAPLVARFGERPLSLRLGKLPLALATCGELVAVTLAGRAAPGELTPRERAAALLYAEGHSYKAIAARLGLSPATVRTYLRDAYLQLGVRNKVELGARLSNG
ncbi:helix-turn-helix transcriptional regulator [Ideonella sp. YS5]|uniref:helix-turn-helix transcriptional regulator n=1 Tax=Ideonella sp. YS5 TaxID=3453714 RepID=UPI003EEE5A25